MISVLLALDDPKAQQHPSILSAIRKNLENAAISSIHVLSATRLTWLQEAFEDLPSQLKLVHRDKIADMRTLFQFGNALLTEGADCVAVVAPTAILPVAGEMASLQAGLNLGRPPIIFALTAPATASLPYEASGLPDYSHIDGWIFSTPIPLTDSTVATEGDLSHAPALFAPGAAIFNPSLGTTLSRHGPSPTTAHTTQTETPQFPPIRLTWLEAGYRPQPLRRDTPTIFFCTGPAATCQSEALLRLARLCQTTGWQGQILCDSDPDIFYRTHAEILNAAPHLILSTISASGTTVCEALLSGRQDRYDRLAFVHSLSQVSAQLLTEAQGIFITTPHLLPDEAEIPGCTLITSVFKSDPFLRGFLNNCKLLHGYGNLIDHIFLVARLSENESDRLNALLSEQPKVMVFWNREDPGLYNCWNLGLRLSQQPYVSNANVDDLRHPTHVTSLVSDLESNPDAYLAASSLNPFYHYPSDGRLPPSHEHWYSDLPERFDTFSLGHLSDDTPPRLHPHNIPHCMPVWRRDLHARFGWFDEARYGTYADWAFWLKVLSDGRTGWLRPQPLGYYFVNASSHNRRGQDLEKYHKRVEDDFVGMFAARRAGRMPTRHCNPVTTARKLDLHGRELHFGEHRNSFNRLINALTPLETPTGDGVLFLPFMERYFIWGDHPGEAASSTPRPLTRDWVGILHVPFDAPDWYDSSVSPETLLNTELWQASKSHCRGLITLSADLAMDLQSRLPDITVLPLRHPADTDVFSFDLPTYLAQPRILQAGDWLRKLQAIHRLKAPGHDRIMLLKHATEIYLQREIARFGDHRDPRVKLLKMVSNDEYDQLLSTSVVLCLLYATAANNLVIECIARATPILINPLPAVIEYLGHDYPLYVQNEEEAEQALSSPRKIELAHLYLLDRRKTIDLSYEGFCYNIASSKWYANL